MRKGSASKLEALKLGITKNNTDKPLWLDLWKWYGTLYSDVLQ